MNINEPAVTAAENTNYTRTEARAVLRVIDSLILLWEHKLDAKSFERFPAASGAG